MIFLMIASSVKSSTDVKSFSNAVNVILKEFYMKNNLRFDFLLIGEKNWTFPREIISNVMKSSHELSPVEIHSKRKKTLRIRLNRSTIIFLESAENVTMLNNKIRMNNKAYMKFQHFVIIQNNTKKIDPGINKYFPNDVNSHIINYEMFMFKNKNGSNLGLEAFEKFSSHECKQGMMRKNQFSMKNQSWMSQEFSLREHDQFHGCVLVFRAVFYELFGEMAMGNPLGEGDIGIFKEFSKKLNFTYYLSGKSEKFDVGCHFRDLHNIDATSQDEYFFYLFFDVREVLFYSTGEEYSSYDKFLLPFDTGTWICCGLFLTGAFLIILIINQLERKIQDFVYGRRVRSPSFNILVALLGQCQNILPTRNFARFLLMIFILFCLIIRNGYQGVQFDMMYTVSIFKIIL